MARAGQDATVERAGSRGNPNVERLAQEHVIAAQVREHTRVFFHDPNLGRLPDGRIVIAAPPVGQRADSGRRNTPPPRPGQ